LIDVRTFPALEVSWSDEVVGDRIDHLVAMIDDTAPLAVEEHGPGVRIFFSDESQRDNASEIAAALFPDATLTSLLVPDDNWAERSQAALLPIRVGNLIIAPPWTLDDVLAHAALTGDSPVVVSIQPSMGFGTGHHASTRLCLRLLQRYVPAGGAVLDIGTGSGVLALSAWRLGARQALGIDFDRDALTSAQENVEANGAGTSVSLDALDITQDATLLSGRFDLVFANITGAMLIKYAAEVASTVASAGILITSGFQAHEKDDVAAAFAAQGLETLVSEEEDTWVATGFKR
jgi:ribosomal protein L11 methyltransferase